ncbi:TetR family transcriptional regulator [Mycobacterium sp. 852002-51971_SCH5477799-a]|uniref:TetR/AcrR family transcriptional regulator n=1 Tax=Mycobacterium sp. 852002-51971_SCH5477799-a TaxID=1834106 RepID=UPI0007FF16EB|nr:TetR/AcrR family transcriptional regulator [Mycobacterium sp. 852002-51971_SCH5477799-a]OBF69622.1 TetR family transcriptional regulator [Mycobacterium sp. 852002-51971_SCH5477799-a]
MPTTDRARRSSKTGAPNPASKRPTKSGADVGARTKLIEATARIMREEGYAAATSRRVAAEAGVKQALVYYYFLTMDDLFVEVLRAGAETALARMRALLTDDDPLQALWLMNSDSAVTALNAEFMALANHRKAIGAELKAYAERVRDIETAAVTMVLRANHIDLEEYPPVAISMLIAQVARSLCNESAVGVTQGHDELRAFVERQMSLLKAPAATPAPSR